MVAATMVAQPQNKVIDLAQESIPDSLVQGFERVFGYCVFGCLGIIEGSRLRQFVGARLVKGTPAGAKFPTGKHELRPLR